MPQASGLKETLLLKQPTVSADEIAFLYAAISGSPDGMAATRAGLPRKKGANLRRCFPRMGPGLRSLATTMAI